MITLQTINNSFYFINDLVIKPNSSLEIDEATLDYNDIKRILLAIASKRLAVSENDLELLNEKEKDTSPTISPSNLKTINGESLLGTGDIVVNSNQSIIEYNTSTSPYRRFFDDFMIATTSIGDTGIYNYTSSAANLVSQQSSNISGGATGVLTSSLSSPPTSYGHLYSVNRDLICPRMLVGEYRYYESLTKPRFAFAGPTPNTQIAVGFFSAVTNLTGISTAYYVTYLASTKTFVGIIKNQGVISTFNFAEAPPNFDDLQYKKMGVKIEKLPTIDPGTGWNILQITFIVGTYTLVTTTTNNSSNTYFGTGTIYTRENTAQDASNTYQLQTDYADYIIYRPDRS